jgi:nucleoside-diphosphate-sugar epimerase
VLCSSGSVYGGSDRDPVTEESPLIPVNSYGASKVASEAIMHAYIHIDDVVEALVAALYAGPTPKRVYNVSGGTSITLMEVANIAAKILPDLSVQFGDDPLSREYTLKQIDISAAKRDLGYAPKVGLAEGIAAYGDRLRAR